MRSKLNCSVEDIYAYTIERSIPLSVLFELTYRCNLRCGHCYMVDRGEAELSLDEVKDILNQLAAANCLFLTLSGGEALMRTDFFDIARYAKAKGFALKIFSNGTLINEDIAHEIARIHPLEVGISIYGSDAASHEQFTGMPGSFRSSLHALRLLKEQGVFTIMKCLLMKGSVAHMNEIRALASEVGAILQFDPIVSPKNDGNRTPLQFELDDSELHRFFSSITDQPQTMGQTDRPSAVIICRAGRDTCSISPIGMVYPCVALPVPLGNLREQNFNKIWYGHKAEKLRKLRFSDLSQCVSCPELSFCTRCWGLATLESGDHLGPSYLNCRIARIRHRISVERAETDLEEVTHEEALRTP